MIPGKLYRLNFIYQRVREAPEHRAEVFTTFEPVSPGVPTNLKTWIRVTPETVLMFLNMEPDHHGNGGSVLYFLVGDKICQWWSGTPDKDFEEIPSC